jgi:hypothetical protein
MPADAAIFVTFVIASFTIFGITLAWAHARAH